MTKTEGKQERGGRGEGVEAEAEGVRGDTHGRGARRSISHKSKRDLRSALSAHVTGPHSSSSPLLPVSSIGPFTNLASPPSTDRLRRRAELQDAGGVAPRDAGV